MPIHWSAIGITLLPNLGGMVGSYFTRKAIKEWYEHLKKPDWTPPNWAFRPVWAFLYCSMGYASYLVYGDGDGFDGPAKLPLIAYGTQLLLNWAWTPIFFGMRSIKANLSIVERMRLDMNGDTQLNTLVIYGALLGLYGVIALDFAAGICGLFFYQINQTAGLLFIPYAAWLTLATTLTAVIYRDNPNPKLIE